MISADYVIVGSGLTGAVIARSLFDTGREVLILERRSYLGGNVHDHTHSSGIRIHTHGPHYFRTNSDRIWEFATRFASFFRYEAALVSLVDGRHENWPIAASYIRERVGAGWKPSYTGHPRNFEEAALSLMPRVVYEKFVKEYNEKQWGVPAHTLAAELCKRFDVRENDEPLLLEEGLGVRVFVGFHERRHKDLGRMARQGAIIVDDVRDGRGIGDKRLVAALPQILLPEVPFERVG